MGYVISDNPIVQCGSQINYFCDAYLILKGITEICKAQGLTLVNNQRKIRSFGDPPNTIVEGPSPFSFQEVETFLNNCAKLIYFKYRNGIISKDGEKLHDSVYSEDVDLNIEIEIPGRVAYIIRAFLNLTFPNMLFEVRIFEAEVSEYRKQGNYTCELGGYSEEDVRKMKYVPRCIGYNYRTSSLNILQLDLKKEISIEESLTLIGIPVLNDYLRTNFFLN